MYLSFRLAKMGALEVDKVVHRHQAWRLISCIWLHGGAIHLLANMLSLVFIGIRLEQEFGFGMVLVIVLALLQYISLHTFSITYNFHYWVFVSSGRNSTKL